MKPSYSPHTERFRTLGTVAVALVLLLAIISHLSAQEGAGAQEIESNERASDFISQG